MADYRIGHRLKRADFSDALGVEGTDTGKTVKRASEEIASEWSIESQVKELVHNIENEHDELVEPPEIKADGICVPVVVQLSRELRQKAYGPIYVDRDEDDSV